MSEAPELLVALKAIIRNPHGCAFCSYGFLKDTHRVVEHEPDCAWVMAKTAIVKAEAQ